MYESELDEEQMQKLWTKLNEASKAINSLYSAFYYGCRFDPIFEDTSAGRACVNALAELNRYAAKARLNLRHIKNKEYNQVD